MRARRWLGWGLRLALGLLLGPPLLFALTRIPPLIWREPCHATVDCNFAIEAAGRLQFALFFLGPPLMLLGALVLLGLAVLRIGRRGALSRTVGTLSVIAVLVLAWIPAGPDACSRHFTDTGYESCLEEIFDGRTMQEARNWLVTSGCRLTGTLETPTVGAPRDDRHRTPADALNGHFQAFRDHGHYRSVPYGTKFNRLFARLGPAPERFELEIYVDTAWDRVIAVDAWWFFTLI